ncbi:hypothetical protein NQ318_018765 [Aromia moschata]|uniref:Mitochondrial carrier protein n=1 Tax=Aromia moschata TaxID=1265417 RepID=A0AAV8ZIT5_9CUCU|nr:hypothetical protein NQ318_018765 [Aromia moschata]
MSEVYYSIIREFYCGLMTSVVTVGITFPITKLTYRQILGGVNSGFAMEQICKEGPYVLYRGYLARLISVTTTLGGYSTVLRAFKHFQLNEYTVKLCEGLILGAVELVFMPFERINVLLIDNSNQDQFKNTFQTFRVLYREYGLKEYYRGYNLVFVKAVGLSYSFLFLHDHIQRFTSGCCPDKEHNLEHFCRGGMIGLISSILVYPLKVTRITVQMDTERPFLSLYESAMLVYKRDKGGMRNFYKGVWTNAFRAFLKWGMFMMTFEYFSFYVFLNCVNVDLLIDISDVLQICCYELGRTYLKLSQALCINIPAVEFFYFKVWKFPTIISEGVLAGRGANKTSK